MQKEPSEIPGFRHTLAEVADTRISYWIGGRTEGPPVLLWHGFLGNSFSWHKVMPLLAGAGCSVLAPDMRGFGDSAKPLGTDGYDGKALAEEFRRLVAENVAGGVIDSSGHFLPEEAPEEVVRSLLDALGQEQKLKSTAHI
ncbi:MAG: alpha/beta fold hydrolase [Verrucomicrobia bacterium]|nr:alpha/beta fold hydrolase [Verrucomicrobiota bacterium]